MNDATTAVTGIDTAAHALAGEKFWPHGWWRLMNAKIGVIPVPLFVLTGLLIAAMCVTKGKLSNEIAVMVATLAFFGFACGEIGKRLGLKG